MPGQALPPTQQRRGQSATHEHSEHFISDYRFLNIIKSLACSGGSVSQSVGVVFLKESPEKERGLGGQTRPVEESWVGRAEAKGRHARRHTHTHTKKSPRETRASVGGREVPREAKTFKR